MKFHVITITSCWFLNSQEKNFKVAFHNTVIIIVTTIHNYYF